MRIEFIDLCNSQLFKFLADCLATGIDVYYSWFFINLVDLTCGKVHISVTFYYHCIIAKECEKFQSIMIKINMQRLTIEVEVSVITSVPVIINVCFACRKIYIESS